MASNKECSSAGAKRRRSIPDGPDPLSPGNHTNLDSTIEAILRKRVRERQDLEKSLSNLLARIKSLEEHAAEGTIPVGLRIQGVKAKGQDADTLQAKFAEIIYAAEVQLLDATIDNLRSNVKDLKAAIDLQARNIDGTIAKWKSNLQQLKEITSDQVDTLVDSAMKFASTLSSESAVACASKTLQAEITRKENKTQESMEQSATFVPSEQSIREIIRQEINRTQETSAANNRSRNRRTVSFFSSPGRANGSENHKQRPHRRNKPNSPHRRSKQAKHPKQQRARSKSPGSNPSRRVTRPRSSSKNAKGKGSGPAK